MRCSPITRSANRRLAVDVSKLSQPLRSAGLDPDGGRRPAARQGRLDSLRRGVSVAAVVVLLASGFAYAAAQFWLAELMSHFRLQYLALGIVLTVAAMLLRQRGLAIVALAAVVLNTVPVYGYFRADAARFAPVARTPVRIAAANVLYSNELYGPMLRWARVQQADVAVFVEVTARWQSELAMLHEFPYRAYLVGSGTRGTMILSKWPMIGQPVILGVQRGAPPAVGMELRVRGKSMRLVAVHARWPLTPRLARERNREFVQIARDARGASAAWVAIGDFNSSPFSPQFAMLLEQGELRRAAAGRGWLPTWPAPLLAMGIQIDHALVSKSVRVRSFHAGLVAGSDHRPIVVDLEF